MDKLIESLESLKWWITLYVTGDLTCGEVREKLEVIDAVIKELKAFDMAIATLKEQEPVRCRDCKWYDERISLCDNCGLPREQTFFCADGKRRIDDA